MDSQTIARIINILEEKYGAQTLRSERTTPFEVLIGTILSQRTKDEVTDVAATKLLGKARTPRQMMNLSKDEIIHLIKPAGFYRQKAGRILEISRILLNEYGGRTPETREELMRLPGVGPKTADCVLCFSYRQPCIPVDTHVKVIARRLGLTCSEDPEKIREDLHNQIPEALRGRVNLLFVNFGKDVCRTVKPRCDICPLARYCDYFKTVKQGKARQTGDSTHA
jgi:endonuclease-3